MYKVLSTISSLDIAILRYFFSNSLVVFKNILFFAMI